MSRLSAKAEYRVMAHTACEMVWLNNSLMEFGFRQYGLMSMYCDNHSAIYIAQNPLFHEKIKHIEINCHFVKDAWTKKLVLFSSHFQSSWLIFLPKLSYLRCFLTYVTS